MGAQGFYSKDDPGDIITFDNSGDFASAEGTIGLWWQVTTTWNDAQYLYFFGGADDYNAILMESTGTNEFTIRQYTGSNQDCSTVSSTTMSTGTWYFIEHSWKTDTTDWHLRISTDVSRGNIYDSDLASATCPDTMDAEPGVNQLIIGAYNYAEDIQYIDNFMVSSSYTKNLWNLRNETTYVAP